MKKYKLLLNFEHIQDTHKNEEPILKFDFITRIWFMNGKSLPFTS